MNSNTFIFCLLYFVTLTLILFSNYLLNINELIYDNIINELSGEHLAKALESVDKLRWLKYIIIFLNLIFKTSIIAMILSIGCFFFNKDIKYKKLFSIVVKAEFVFLLVIVFKTAWFYWFHQDYTLEDLQYFYPLSAINITGYQDLQAWFVYPLQVLNLFELAYWFILAYLLGKALNESTDKGLGIVASSYGVGLLIWVVAVMFFTLNMS